MPQTQPNNYIFWFHLYLHQVRQEVGLEQGRKGIGAGPIPKSNRNTEGDTSADYEPISITYGITNFLAGTGSIIDFKSTDDRCAKKPQNRRSPEVDHSHLGCAAGSTIA
jgi:hypothetical protein